MVKHIVTFKLKGTPEERLSYATDFKAALMALPEEVPVLRGIEVGINQNPNEDWDIVLTAVVDRLWTTSFKPLYLNDKAPFPEFWKRSFIVSE